MPDTIDTFLKYNIWIPQTSEWAPIMKYTTTFERCQMAVAHLAVILEKERYEDMLWQAKLNENVIEGELV